MTIVSKASAYPKSVQSGLPRLGACPPGWTRGPLSIHLIEELRPLNMADDEVYDLVTVKRSRGGVVLRERLKGSQIAVKSQFRLKAGDFLISKRQIVHGACGIVPPALDDAIVSNEYSVLRARPTLDLDFLNCLAHSIYFQQTCFHSSIGVHVEKMIFKLDEWMKWDFNLPTLWEQRRIAEILSTWDRAIETEEALIANAGAQKAALMQLLLTGKSRLPGFGGVWRGITEEQGGSGTIPDGWAYNSLDQLASIKRGKFSVRPRNDPRYFGGKTPFVQTGDVVAARTLLTEFSQTLNDDGVAVSKVFPAGTILMTIAANIGDTAITAFPVACPDSVVGIEPYQAHTDTEWLRAALDARKSDLDAQAPQNAQKNINLEVLKPLQLLTPPLQEQRRIAGILSTRDRAIDAMEAQLAALCQEKAGLLQQLLTGKRRVKLADAAAA